MNPSSNQEARTAALGNLNKKKDEFKAEIQPERAALDKLRDELYPKNSQGKREPVDPALNAFEVHQNSSSDDGSVIDDQDQRDIKGRDHFAPLNRAQMQALLVDAFHSKDPVKVLGIMKELAKQVLLLRHERDRLAYSHTAQAEGVAYFAKHYNKVDIVL